MDITTLDAEVGRTTYGTWKVDVRINGTLKFKAFESTSKIKAEGVRDFFNGGGYETFKRELAAILGGD